MTTESLAQALHAAERAWLVEQGWAQPHPWTHVKGRSTCCDLGEREHSPLVVEWLDLPNEQQARYRALAAVQGGAAAQSAEESWERYRREKDWPVPRGRGDFLAGYEAGAAWK